VCIQPRENLRVPALSGRITRPSVPRAAVLPRTLQQLQEPAQSSLRTTAYLHHVLYLQGNPILVSCRTPLNRCGSRTVVFAK